MVEEKEAEDDELDFGDDDSDDDDDDYQESNLPWHKRRQQQTRAASRMKDVEDDDDSDVDMEEETLMNKAPRGDGAPVVEADLEDYSKITLPRRRLSRWCNEPFFKKAVINSFVRLLIGDHDGKKCYRLCQIVDIKKGKKNYNFPAPNPREKPVSLHSMMLLLGCLSTVILSQPHFSFRLKPTNYLFFDSAPMKRNFPCI